MRNLLPYLFSFIAVAVTAAYIVYEGARDFGRIALPPPEEPVVEDSVPEEPRSFHGRVELPPVEDILVLSNSADRDIEKLATYFEGRSAGLHWIAQSYFKKHRNSAEDETLGESIRQHIETYWRYRKSESGYTELWLPVRFRAVY